MSARTASTGLALGEWLLSDVVARRTVVTYQIVGVYQVDVDHAGAVRVRAAELDALRPDHLSIMTTRRLAAGPGVIVVVGHFVVKSLDAVQRIERPVVYVKILPDLIEWRFARRSTRLSVLPATGLRPVFCHRGQILVPKHVFHVRRSLKAAQLVVFVDQLAFHVRRKKTPSRPTVDDV